MAATLKIIAAVVYKAMAMKTEVSESCYTSKKVIKIDQTLTKLLIWGRL